MDKLKETYEAADGPELKTVEELTEEYRQLASAVYGVEAAEMAMRSMEGLTVQDLDTAVRGLHGARAILRAPNKR